MMNASFKSSSLIGVWVASVALVVAASMEMGAEVSTTALLIGLSITPAIVVVALAMGRPSPSVAHILHSLHAKDGRS